MPINMYLVKRGASVSYQEMDGTATGRSSTEADADEFCGFPHLPSDVQLAVIDWGEFYGD